MSVDEVAGDEVLRGTTEFPDLLNTGDKGNITGFTKHGINRAIGSPGRVGVRPSAILDAVNNPLKINSVIIDQLGRPSQRFIGQFAEVVINPQTGRIISVNPTSSSKSARLLRKLLR